MGAVGTTLRISSSSALRAIIVRGRGRGKRKRPDWGGEREKGWIGGGQSLGRGREKGMGFCFFYFAGATELVWFVLPERKAINPARPSIRYPHPRQPSTIQRKKNSAKNHLGPLLSSRFWTAWPKAPVTPKISGQGAGRLWGRTAFLMSSPAEKGLPLGRVAG